METQHRKSVDLAQILITSDTLCFGVTPCALLTIHAKTERQNPERTPDESLTQDRYQTTNNSSSPVLGLFGVIFPA